MILKDELGDILVEFTEMLVPLLRFILHNELYQLTDRLETSQHVCSLYRGRCTCLLIFGICIHRYESTVFVECLVKVTSGYAMCVTFELRVLA